MGRHVLAAKIERHARAVFKQNRIEHRGISQELADRPYPGKYAL
jgi:hypothetical protein